MTNIVIRWGFFYLYKRTSHSCLSESIYTYIVALVGEGARDTYDGGSGSVRDRFYDEAAGIIHGEVRVSWLVLLLGEL